MTVFHRTSFLMLAALYLVLTICENSLSTFSLAILKILPITILLHLASSKLQGKHKTILQAALLFSIAGDVLLAFGSDYFIFGLAAFLVAQMSYTFRFSLDFSWNPQRLSWAAILVMFMLSLSLFVLPATEEMQLPVTIYMLAIFSMGLTACFRRTQYFPITTLGAFIFIVSDSLIAIDKFLFSLPNASLLIMFTYYFAQYLLTKGLMKP